MLRRVASYRAEGLKRDQLRLRSIQSYMFQKKYGR
jgi:hypothetical protein